MKQVNTTPAFTVLLKRYNADPCNPDHLVNLATAVVHSVLRKVIDPRRKHIPKTDPAKIPTDPKKRKGSGQSPALIALRRELFRDRAYLSGLDHAVNGVTRLAYNEDGDLVQEVVDPDLDAAAGTMIKQALGDGLDLVNDAIVALLDETRRQAEREPDLQTDLERKYTVRRLKRKVWIKTEDSAGGFEVVETSPIREVYRSVRRAIQSSRAVQTDPKNGYLYIEDLVTDPVTGAETCIYRRLPKYTDAGTDGGHAPDSYIPGQPAELDGRPTRYSADRETVEATDRLIAAMRLTDREMTVLGYRLSGYGYKAIATVLGITLDNVKRCVRRIREKAVAAGMTPTAAVK